MIYFQPRGRVLAGVTCEKVCDSDVKYIPRLYYIKFDFGLRSDCDAIVDFGVSRNNVVSSSAPYLRVHNMCPGGGVDT